ncbi:MAG: orotate phosphoribosyltransferase [Candidatus Eremiobacteraeota bacterium]|jgi:orotate phosphoribosyltransferase|nr:orotate phosphoribosyltransferase [Candidatus Eremiobacteraeota bacterium]
MQAPEMWTRVATTAAHEGEAVSGELVATLNALRDLIQTESITRKAPGEPDYVLASGRHSRYYCDLKKVTLSPEGSWLVGELLFQLYDGATEAVGGLQLGATFMATAVALVSAQHGRPIYGFTIRDTQKQHGTRENKAESYHPDGALLCSGRRVVIVDDVVTEGGSILKAINAVRDLECEIVEVVALVDRGEGGTQRLRAMGLPYISIFEADPSGSLRISSDLQRRKELPRVVPT